MSPHISIRTASELKQNGKGFSLVLLWLKNKISEQNSLKINKMYPLANGLIYLRTLDINLSSSPNVLFIRLVLVKWESWWFYSCVYKIYLDNRRILIFWHFFMQCLAVCVWMKKTIKFVMCRNEWLERISLGLYKFWIYIFLLKKIYWNLLEGVGFDRCG